MRRNRPPTRTETPTHGSLGPRGKAPMLVLVPRHAILYCRAKDRSGRWPGSVPLPKAPTKVYLARHAKGRTSARGHRNVTRFAGRCQGGARLTAPRAEHEQYPERPRLRLGPAPRPHSGRALAGHSGTCACGRCAPHRARNPALTSAGGRFRCVPVFLTSPSQRARWRGQEHLHYTPPPKINVKIKFAGEPGNPPG